MGIEDLFITPRYCLYNNIYLHNVILSTTVIFPKIKLTQLWFNSFYFIPINKLTNCTRVQSLNIVSKL